MNVNSCLICKADSNQIPVIQFEFKGNTYHICTQHIPVLIHQANKLAEFLPGLENAEDVETFTE